MMFKVLSLFAVIAGVSAQTLIQTNALCHQTGSNPFQDCFIRHYDMSMGRIFNAVYANTSIETPETTILYPGLESYDFVIKYENTITNNFKYNMVFYPADGVSTVDCATVGKVHYGTGIGQSVVLDLIGDGTYCTIDIDYKLTRAQLNDTSNVLFAFNHFVGDLETMEIIKDTTGDIIRPMEELEVYRYNVDQTVVESFLNDDFLLRLTVSDIHHGQFGGDFGGTGCKTMDQVMASIMVDGCLLTMDSFQVVDGDTTTYDFVLARSRLENCSQAVTLTSTQITYSSEIYLEGQAGGPDACYYFQPHNDNQLFDIIINKAVEDTTTGELDNFQLVVKSIDVERCLPLESFIIPQVTMVFEVEIDFNGVNVDTTTLMNTGMIGPNNEQLVLDSETCVANKCTYILKSTQCTPIYTNTLDECVIDSKNYQTIQNMTFNQNYTDTTEKERFFFELRTFLEFTTFTQDKCAMTEASVVDVTQSYSVKTQVRNLNIVDKTVQTGWDQTDPSVVYTSDYIAIRTSLFELDGTDSDITLFIKNVIVTLIDNDTSENIVQYAFNKVEKEAMMGNTWELYYYDPHFCSKFDTSVPPFMRSPGLDGLCIDKFYDDTTTRWNPFMNGLDVDFMCQEQLNDHSSTDYFVFLPSIWFDDVKTTSVSLKFDVSGVIERCSGTKQQNGRLLRALQVNGGEQQATEYVTSSIQVDLQPQGSVDTKDSGNTTSDDTMDKSDLKWIIPVCIFGTMVFCLIVFLVFRKKNNNQQ